MLAANKVQSFDRATLYAALQEALAADEMIGRWQSMAALLDAHLAATDDAAIGGDRAYGYGRDGTLAGIGAAAAAEALRAPGFASAPQPLGTLASPEEGAARLA